jgi:hypothetical protein
MKKLVLVAVAALIIGVGAYAGSPYLAASNLKAAAVKGDADQIEANVDFPAVRDSLKSQMSAAMMQKLNSDPEMKDNPFAGLGMMMMPAIVDRAVDAYVTPDGLAAVIRGSKPNDAKGSDGSTTPNIEYDYEWVSSDRFRVNLTNIQKQQSGLALVFERRGVVSWKLIKVDLDDSFFEG